MSSGERLKKGYKDKQTKHNSTNNKNRSLGEMTDGIAN